MLLERNGPKNLGHKSAYLVCKGYRPFYILGVILRSFNAFSKTVDRRVKRMKICASGLNIYFII